MATKVKVDFRALKRNLLNKQTVINNATKKKLGKFVDKETKKRIAVGKSPVMGVGRFKAYAIQRLGKGYPSTVRGKFPGKKNRPVNLSLDGTFLDNIGFKPIKTGIEYGLQSNEKLMKDMFETHNDGKHSDVPQRKFIPNKRGDKYTPDILKGIKGIYSKRIKDIIKKMND